MARTKTKTAHAPAQFSQASIALYDQAQPGMLATTTTGRIGIITEKFVSLGGMPHVWLQEPGAALTSQPIDLIAKVENKPIAVILFAGGGGVECGMVAAGIEPILSVEYDPDKPDVSGAITDCHKKNFPRCKVIRRTVQECAAENFAFFPQEPDILWASPVCSNFSAAKNGEEQIEDVLAAKAVVQAIAAMSPKHFLLENVTGYASSVSWGGLKESIPQVEINQLNPNLFLSLISRPVVIKAYAIFALGFWVFRAVQEPDHKPWRGIEAHIKQLGYQVDSSAVNMSDYGVPQARVRFIVRACREGNPLPLPEKQPKISWYDAIADLIPALPDSKLLDGQQKSVDKFLKANAPVPLLVNRGIGRTCYKVVPSHDPAKTVMRSHFTDHRGNSRSKFADIWLPDGTVKSVSIECMARLQSFPDWYQFPEQVAIAGSIIGYSVPPKFVEQLIKPLTETEAEADNHKIALAEIAKSAKEMECPNAMPTVKCGVARDNDDNPLEVRGFKVGERVVYNGNNPEGGIVDPALISRGEIISFKPVSSGCQIVPYVRLDDGSERFFPWDGLKKDDEWVAIPGKEIGLPEREASEALKKAVDADHDSEPVESDYSALSIAEIRRDGGTQPREKLDLAHKNILKEAIEDGAELDPVVVFYDGESYWLADGFHRCKATEESGFEDIDVIIHQGTRRDAILYSVGANAEHKAAKPRSRADKRRAVMMLLNDPEWSKWSDREIARQCKVDHKTVGRFRSSLTGEFPSEDGQQRTYKTKHGTTATMKVGNIGNGKNDLGAASAADNPLLDGTVAEEGNGNGEMETDTPKPTINPDDYALAFLSNLDNIKTDLLREARARIDAKLNTSALLGVEPDETVKAVVENADRFSADEVRLMIEVLKTHQAD
ncbi:DNA cytosine methyltransferase [Coleofasciculus sp.]|uniref:DNA cytosine methyltransferase n=1 Tax=Coleofasciculus sp. TaxID=3100458 RepID=UPI0039F88E9F